MGCGPERAGISDAGPQRRRGLRGSRLHGRGPRARNAGFGVRDTGPWVARSSRAGLRGPRLRECGIRPQRRRVCKAVESRVSERLGFGSVGTRGLRGVESRGDGPRRCGARERGKAGASEPQGFRGGFGMWDADLREQHQRREASERVARGLGGTGPGRWGAGLRGAGPRGVGLRSVGRGTSAAQQGLKAGDERLQAESFLRVPGRRARGRRGAGSGHEEGRGLLGRASRRGVGVSRGWVVRRCGGVENSEDGWGSEGGWSEGGRGGFVPPGQEAYRGEAQEDQRVEVRDALA